MKDFILIADSLHINRRNFGSFYKYIDKNQIKIHIENKHQDLISLYGVYDHHIDVLYDKIEYLLKIEKNELYNFKIFEHNLFKICRAEILSFVLTKPEWYNFELSHESKSIFDKLYKFEKVTLIQNMAASWFWLEFWRKRLAELGLFSHACIFSGSLIYQKALIELLKNTSTKVMLMESTYVGTQYYFEENYTHIANNSNIKQVAVYKKYVNQLINTSPDENDRERIKAINKLVNLKNKNVTQPDSDNKPDLIFREALPVITIIGQVVNDFSVIEYKNIGMSTISFYKKLITKLIKQNFNVILKTHPWEEAKINIKTALTKQVMINYLSTLPEEYQGRIKIVDHYAIKKLFNQSDWIVGLNSQGLLEAAFEGFKPVQFGDAFYGKKGFTTDYSIEDIDLFITDLLLNKIPKNLTLNEFDLYEQFMTIYLQKHTVCTYDSGMNLLKSLFDVKPLVHYIPMVPIVRTDINVDNSEKILEKKQDEKTLEKKQDEKILEKKQDEKILEKKQGEKILEKKQGEKILEKKQEGETLKKNKIDKLTSEKTKAKKINRKYKKFIRNPWRFFHDSKKFYLRPLRFLFKFKG